MRLVNPRNGRVVADRVEFARGLLPRLLGLMRRTVFEAGSALVIPGCRQVHTFLMRFPIDLAFTDSEGKVIGLEKDVQPSCVSGRYASAFQTIELPAGTIVSSDIREGDVLVFER